MTILRSQQEPSCLATFCKHMGYDALFNARFKGNDLYSEVASACFNQPYELCCEFDENGHKNPPEYKERRSQAKPVLLGILYGRGDASVAEQMNITLSEAEQLKANLFSRFPEIKKFEDESIAMAEDIGYVTTVCGRKRRLPEMQLDEFEFKWIDGKVHGFDPLDFEHEFDDSVSDEIKRKYLSRLTRAKFKDKPKIISQARQDGISIIDNGGKIAEATRQVVNSRIQGCLSGDVRVQSKELGFIKLKDYVNNTLSLWDGSEWTDGAIVYSGKKRKCILTFSTGQKIVCSPNHKFLTVNTRGNKHFKALSDIKSGDRIAINHTFVDSDYKYNSNWLDIDLCAHNAIESHLDDISDSFDIGLFLGRLASDGSYRLRGRGASNIRHIIAEHEFSILPILERICEPFHFTTTINSYPRENRNQRMGYLNIYNKSLTSEIVALDIKHTIHDNLFMDTELLRGFVSGFFDGDGGITGDHSISLTFGKQYDFTNLINELQKALLFFGIASYQRHYAGSHRLYIRAYDAHKFCSLVGFINDDKQKKALRIHTRKDNHTFNGESVLTVKTVEITNDYIDMYDVCNTKNGYFIADGLVTHNSAADLTKLAMIKLHKHERLKELGFRMLIPIHDEILAECPEENIKECSELLAKVMSDAAQEILHMPFSCDVEISKAWFGERIEL